MFTLACIANKKQNKKKSYSIEIFKGLVEITKFDVKCSTSTQVKGTVVSKFSQSLGQLGHFKLHISYSETFIQNLRHIHFVQILEVVLWKPVLLQTSRERACTLDIFQRRKDLVEPGAPYVSNPLSGWCDVRYSTTIYGKALKI